MAGSGPNRLLPVPVGWYLMGVYAQPYDVLALLTDKTVDEAMLAEMLDVAEMRLLVRVPSIPQRIASGTLNQQLVRAALVDMVVRVVLNPAPTQESFSMQGGPFGYSGKFAAGSNRIVVLDSDLVGLLPTRNSRSVGCIRLGIGL